MTDLLNILPLHLAIGAEVTSGGEAETFQIRLRQLVQQSVDASLSGLVTDSAGNPLSDADVILTVREGQVLIGITHSNGAGAFSFAVSACPCELWVSAHGFRRFVTAPVRLQTGTPRVLPAITLEPERPPTPPAQTFPAQTVEIGPAYPSPEWHVERMPSADAARAFVSSLYPDRAAEAKVVPAEISARSSGQIHYVWFRK